MNLYHDPTICDRAMCSLCRSHEEGYARGKLAAYAEVRARLTDDTHAPDCGCEPCLLIRAARSSGPARRRVRVASEFLPDPASKPDVLPESMRPRYMPVDKLCLTCEYPFITPPTNPSTEQCDLHRAFESPRPNRNFGEPY